MQVADPVSVDPGKAQVIDRVPKVIKEITFGVLSSQDIISQAHVEVSDRKLFDLDNDRIVARHGPLDSRMGISSKSGTCETCGSSLQECNGHFGYVKLVLPAFHVGYFKRVIGILQEICKDCSRILLPEPERRSFLKEMRRPAIDNLRRVQINKRINERCRKTRVCYTCNAVNGVVKKTGTSALKITHERFRAFNASASTKKVPPPSKVIFDQSFDEAKKSIPDIEKNFKKAHDDLNPLRVLKLFRRISNEDCELLGLNPKEVRPENFLWQFIPAPPVSIRPSVGQEGASTEDDLTAKLGDIVHSNINLKNAMNKGAPIQTIMECWDYMQLQIAVYINSDVPGLQKADFGKAIRGVCQRLKGKQGRFRGNLSGKRVDFSGRTVISPDPNLRIDEVAVPQLVAMNMTYPERVTKYNKEKLRGRVRNGTKTWPGANYISKRGTSLKVFLKYGNLRLMADQLEEGDVVERHLEDGDIVLFNRQPSLHKLSILSHFVKVRPHRTFRLNECVCNPYNADFDGDEMNLHVPQTEEARAEAMELMGVKNNLATPKNGEPIIAAIQDFITAAFLLSSKDNFFDRKTFTQICLYMLHSETRFDLPPPTVLKPQMLWTGKQVFNVLMRPNRDSPVLVNLDAACRAYKYIQGQAPDLDANDGWLCIRNSEIMCGVADKSTIGSGKKDNIIFVVQRDFGPAAAAEVMNRLSRLSARWLTNLGFSVGITDVYPVNNLVQLKQRLVDGAFAESAALIEKLKADNFVNASGGDERQNTENSITGLLNKVRQQAGEFCIAELSKHNAPLVMATSGSKGSSINVSQMVALVGQQTIEERRVSYGFQDRTLPHFARRSQHPLAKGFVQNSFFSGLSPTEFFFHAMSGREGLIDTAVKTAETGYMSRRLMKSLEDLSTRYDGTVRSSTADVVQFQYGDDQLEPVAMEGVATPVHFERTFTAAETTLYDAAERGLGAAEIEALCEQLLAPERAQLARVDLLGRPLAYDDATAGGVDQRESERAFLAAIAAFVRGKAARLEAGGANASAAADADAMARAHTARLPARTLTAFVRACLHKYRRARVEPGHAVGAVGAQSIGEPGTQMTLKTFHFAGVAGMGITQGVPRIKEIINASRAISTPIVTCALVEARDVRAAQIVKGRIERTCLGDVARYIEEDWTGDAAFLNVKIDFATIHALRLELTMADVVAAIRRHRLFRARDLRIRAFRAHVHVFVDQAAGGSAAVLSKSEQKLTGTDPYFRLKHLKRVLPTIAVLGHAGCRRAVLHADANSGLHTLLVEGQGLRACMTTDGVDGARTRTNDVMETRAVLGIEAARTTIAREMTAVMAEMGIDPRHMQLLADVMTAKGDVLGITRFGLAKMRDSVLQLASFEKTADHLFAAGGAGRADRVEGVSECIIVGKSVALGTGALEVVRSLNLAASDVARRKTVFDDAWAAGMRRATGR
ncbi:DNA-directed RNA polymerase III subunit C1 (rpo31) [Ophidiomyces ophidiicola]|nr:DNA-directed RNA polymerase III subunit C1 (rpo31) [Ophidiomyces ophidiicola]KAI1986748.1 DNA-directed RNA polymerase III subunit C1 (rpo31) [Ophidiomyces ophidiicola]